MSEPLEGNLGSLTNEEWLRAHEKLAELIHDDPDFPDEELTFVWDPDLDPRVLIDDDEVDYGPEREA